MTNLPKHVAIVMDGNGRWAKQRHLPRIAGHQAGEGRAREIITACGEKGIDVLSLFVFSCENWGRPQDEVNLLMELFFKVLEKEGKALHENNVQLKVIGDRTQFGTKLQSKISEVEQLTAANSGLKLILAANYSGRWELAAAARQLALRASRGDLDPDNITPNTFESALALPELPDVDLFIRTSGEMRISNFMLWQLAYAELYFSDKHWPDFDRNAFDQALAFYATRVRRFGLTDEQITD